MTAIVTETAALRPERGGNHQAKRAAAPTAERILQTGFGFWPSRVLLSATELGLFTELARGPRTLAELSEKFGLHARSAADFLDGLVAMDMLTRDAHGRYGNTPETDRYLDRNKATYVGGILEMAAARLYPFWGRLTEALHTGKPQNEARDGNPDFFAALYAEPARLKQFAESMTGLSLPAAEAIAAKFEWAEHQTFADVGCAQGCVPVMLAQKHGHLRGIGWDLPAVGPIFGEYARAMGVSDRLSFGSGDFFVDPLPRVDVIVLGHILHDWDLDQKRLLLRKAYEALPAGGAVIAYDAMIDDGRKENVFGLMMSLNMLIETPGGFDYTPADCVGWMREVGFARTRVEHLVGPDTMVVGYK